MSAAYATEKDPDDVILSLKAATTLDALESAADLIRELSGDDKQRAQARVSGACRRVESEQRVTEQHNTNTGKPRP